MTNDILINFNAFFKVTYGLYIVSSKLNDKLNGFVSNSVFQVTAEPVKFAVCCHKNNFTAILIKESSVFSVSVLQKDTNAGLIGLFGYKNGRDVNKFKKVNYITGKTGVPIVTDDTIAWFECEVTQTFDVGTHLLFIGKVISSDLVSPEKDPLTYTYYREVKKGFAPENAPTFIDRRKIEQKAIISKQARKFKCTVCGYNYDPLKGDETGSIPGGTGFEDLPEEWVCPVCGTRKADFIELG